MRHVYGAGSDFGGDTRRYLDLAAGRAQPDLFSVTDTQLFGVVGVDLYESVRIVEKQDVVFALEGFAVFYEDVLVPVVEGVPKYKGERIIFVGGSLGLSGYRNEFQFPFRGLVTKSEPREIPCAE